MPQDDSQPKRRIPACRHSGDNRQKFAERRLGRRPHLSYPIVADLRQKRPKKATEAQCCEWTHPLNWPKIVGLNENMCCLGV